MRLLSIRHRRGWSHASSSICPMNASTASTCYTVLPLPYSTHRTGRRGSRSPSGSRWDEISQIKIEVSAAGPLPERGLRNHQPIVAFWRRRFSRKFPAESGIWPRIGIFALGSCSCTCTHSRTPTPLPPLNDTLRTSKRQRVVVPRSAQGGFAEEGGVSICCVRFRQENGPSATAFCSPASAVTPSDLCHLGPAFSPLSARESDTAAGERYTL